MKKNYVVILFLITALSCYKKQTNIMGDKTDILTTGTWRLTSYTRYDIMGLHDIYSGLPDCRKDDYTRFNRDGTAEINEGPSKCNSADPQSHNIQWKFLNAYCTRIEIDGQEYVVDRLENNEFRISSPSTFATESVFIYNR